MKIKSLICRIIIISFKRTRFLPRNYEALSLSLLSIITYFTPSFPRANVTSSLSLFLSSPFLFPPFSHHRFLGRVLSTFSSSPGSPPFLRFVFSFLLSYSLLLLSFTSFSSYSSVCFPLSSVRSLIFALFSSLCFAVLTSDAQHLSLSPITSPLSNIW